MEKIFRIQDCHCVLIKFPNEAVFKECAKLD